MSKPSIEQTKMGAEGIAFCIARTLIERDPSLKAPMRANLRKMWELLEEREDHGAADMVDTMIKALNDPHAQYFDPSETVRFERRSEGQIGGIGADVSVIDGQIIVQQVMAGQRTAAQAMQAVARAMDEAFSA